MCTISQAQIQAINLAGPQGRINFWSLPKADELLVLNQIKYTTRVACQWCIISLPENNRKALELLSKRLVDETN